MKRGFFAVSVLALAALATSPAHGLTYTLKITGHLTQQTSAGAPTVVNLGDALMVEARVDADRVVAWGDSGYNVAFLDGLPMSGGEHFRMSLNGLTYGAGDEYNDGLTRFQRTKEIRDENGDEISIEDFFGAYPAIIFDESHVLGLAGGFSPSGNKPMLFLGSGPYGYAYYAYDEQGHLLMKEESFGGSPSSQFYVSSARYYVNTYDGPEFDGIWNVQGSTVAVPEPSTWLLLLGGSAFGGTRLRRRNRAPVVGGLQESKGPRSSTSSSKA